jgi:hypothetical protein
MLVWECEVLTQRDLANKLSKIFEAGRVDMAKPIEH